jgi:ligand-binding sensor domain-containing protein
MRATLVVLAVLGLAAGGGAAALAGDRLRHLAIPVMTELADRDLPGGATPAPLPGCAVAERTRVPGRVTALLEVEGALFVGTFDGGVVLAAPERRAALDLDGRERFVNALAEDAGGVWVATQRGAILFKAERRVATAAPGVAVTSFARAGGALLAGTARGLVRLRPDGRFEPILLGGDDASPRVNALAAGRSALWIGTPAGALAVPLGSDGALAGPARWIPLVFGVPAGATGARTDVVTALAPLGDGALAGTDDGGLVRLGPDGGVAALRLAGARDNDVNPGAMLADGERVLAGTQGGGLLAVDLSAGVLAVRRPEATAALAISAVARGSSGWLAGTSDGRVLELRCPGTTSPELRVGAR